MSLIGLFHLFIQNLPLSFIEIDELIIVIFELEAIVLYVLVTLLEGLKNVFDPFC